MERQRAIEREAARLEREREKLRLERERIEQEKAELLRLERERQKVEREKLERERLELKRQQMRLEERRPPPPATLKRAATDRREYVETERKRIASEHPGRRHSPERTERRTDVMERISDRRIDTSAPRYEGARKEVIQKTFKSFASRSREEYDSSRGREGTIVRRDTRPNMDHRPVKERSFSILIMAYYQLVRDFRSCLEEFFWYIQVLFKLQIRTSDIWTRSRGSQNR